MMMGTPKSSRFFVVLANTLTIIRILLIPFILTYFIEGDIKTSFHLFILAAITDALDGFFARYFNGKSSLGRFLDPLADKLVMTAVLCLLLWHPYIPWYFFGLIFIKDLCIALTVLFFRQQKIPFHNKPLFMSKLNTFLLSVLIAITFYFAAYTIAPPLAWHGLLYATMVTSLASWYSYFKRGMHDLKDHRKKNGHEI